MQISQECDYCKSIDGYASRCLVVTFLIQFKILLKHARRIGNRGQPFPCKILGFFDTDLANSDHKFGNLVSFRSEESMLLEHILGVNFNKILSTTFSYEGKENVTRHNFISS